jgi:hypothetical protein
MIAVQALVDALAALLADDISTLGPALAMAVGLYKNDVPIGADTVFADLVEADFGGYIQLNAAAGGPSNIALDPFTNEWIVEVQMPGDGWRWRATAKPWDDQTIYGFFLVLNDGTTLKGAQAFDVPIPITLENQQVEIPVVRFRLPISPLS